MSRMLERATQVFLQHLSESHDVSDFRPVVNALREALLLSGIEVSRIQIPMTKIAGFRHPRYWAVILTWSARAGFDETYVVTHDERARGEDRASERTSEEEGANVRAPPKDSPFYELYSRSVTTYRVRLTEDRLDYPILEKFKAQGRVDYLAFAIQLPGNPLPQFLSLCADAPFPDHVEATVEQLRDVLSLTLYASYRQSQAVEVSRVYLGDRTGPKVLQGAIARGHTSVIRAGLIFCDVRGYTAMSQRLGGPQTVVIMNEVFEVIGDATASEGGEILKFIGDAMLIVFPLDDISEEQVARAMYRAIETASSGVARVAERHTETLSAGFGCHMGEVVYGNIGTPSRLDFTVMGPSVNLTSRLESLTKTVGAPALFSEEVAQHIPGLQDAGRHALKGIRDPVRVFRSSDSRCA